MQAILISKISPLHSCRPVPIRAAEAAGKSASLPAVVRPLGVGSCSGPRPRGGRGAASSSGRGNARPAPVVSFGKQGERPKVPCMDRDGGPATAPGVLRRHGLVDVDDPGRRQRATLGASEASNSSAARRWTSIVPSDSPRSSRTHAEKGSDPVGIGMSRRLRLRQVPRETQPAHGVTEESPPSLGRGLDRAALASRARLFRYCRLDLRDPDSVAGLHGQQANQVQPVGGHCPQRASTDAERLAMNEIPQTLLDRRSRLVPRDHAGSCEKPLEHDRLPLWLEGRSWRQPGAKDVMLRRHTRTLLGSRLERTHATYAAPHRRRDPTRRPTARNANPTVRRTSRRRCAPRPRPPAADTRQKALLPMPSAAQNCSPPGPLAS